MVADVHECGDAQLPKPGTAARVALLEAPERMEHRPRPGTLEVDCGLVAGVNRLLCLGTFRAGLPGIKCLKRIAVLEERTHVK